MHGTESRDLESRALRFSAPRKPVSPTSGYNASKHTTSVIFSKTGPVARNGLSLPCNDCPFQGLHSRIEVPGLLLRFFTNRFHCPFGPLLHSLYRFAPARGRFHASGPLQFPRPASRLLFQPPLPFGTFRSLRIKVFNWSCRRAARLPATPDSYRSPQPGLISKIGCGSSFQVRYFSPGLLPFEPLGTIYMVYRNLSFVNC